MGFDKLVAPIADKPVIEHAVDAFEGARSVTEIIIVTRTDRISELKDLLRGKQKITAVVAGGEHRQDSVQAGLNALSATAKYVAVHDAARPLITAEQIESVFAQARAQGAASLAEPVTDTLQRADEKLYVRESIDRQHVYAMQTPQIFDRDLLEEAYRAVLAKKLQITDDVSALEQVGHKVVIVPATDFNFKVTFERDLRVADFLLRERGGQA